MTAPVRVPCRTCGREVLVRDVDRGPRGNGEGPRNVHLLRVHYPLSSRYGGYCDESGTRVDLANPLGPAPTP